MWSQRSSFASASGASSRLLLPVVSLVVWGWVAISAVTWGLRWSAIGQSPSSPAVAAQAGSEVNSSASASASASAVARTLGAASIQPVATGSLASRIQLLGVLAGEASQGAALIAVDGHSAKPYRVGAVVVDGWVLQSAQGRRISLGAAIDGPQTLVLELPVKP